MKIISSIYEKDYLVTQKIHNHHITLDYMSQWELQRMYEEHLDNINSLIAVIGKMNGFTKESVKMIYKDEEYKGCLYSESRSLSIFDILYKKNGKSFFSKYPFTDSLTTQIRLEKLIDYSVYILHWWNPDMEIQTFKNLCLYQTLNLVKDWFMFEVSSVSMIRKKINDSVDTFFNNIISGLQTKPCDKTQPYFTNLSARNAHSKSGEYRSQKVIEWMKVDIPEFRLNNERYPTMEELVEIIKSEIEKLDCSERKLFSKLKFDRKTMKKWIAESGFGDVKLPRKNQIKNKSEK